MTKIAILVGTTLGSSEYIADEMQAQLTKLGHEVDTFLSPTLDSLQPYSLWIIVSSTHGAGDLPDNLQPFCKEVLLNTPNLHQIKFALCAIGDSSYDTFCQGPEKLVDGLEYSGAKAFVDKIQIDVQQDPVPEDPTLAWLAQWQDQI